MTRSEGDAKISQRVVNAYHRICETDDWDIVREDLETRFGMRASCFQPLPSGVLDPIQGAHKDGARSVMCHIDFMLRQKVVGDANVEEPNVRVIK